MTRRLLLLFALALALPLAAGAAAPVQSRAEVKEKIQGTRQDLTKLRKEIKQGQQVVQQHARQEKSLLGQLEQLNRELESARRESGTQVRNLALIEERLLRIRTRLAQLQAEEGSDRASLKRFVADLYKARARRGPALLFSARTPFELAARARYLGALSEATQRRVRSLKERIDQVDSYRKEFTQRESELKQHRSDVEASRARVERERLRRQALLKGVRSKKARAAEMVKGLELSAGRLQGLLDGLQKEAARLAKVRKKVAPSAPGGRSSLRRGLAWPTAGRLVSRYGKQRHPVFNTPVFNRGIEIAAAYGAPIRAVASGTVLHAAEMEGFGNLVVLDHGGGMMSVYGYASALHVQAGQDVALGDLLAGVGEAGASGQPALYFEIRQGAKALDPFTYLRRR